MRAILSRGRSCVGIHTLIESVLVQTNYGGLKEVEIRIITYDIKVQNWLYRQFNHENEVHLEIQRNVPQKYVVKQARIIRLQVETAVKAQAKLMAYLVADNCMTVQGQIKIKPIVTPEKVIFT